VDVETRQLSDIAEVGSLLDRAGLDYWLFGGWAVDFYVGKVTRGHGDIDLAVWLKDGPALSGLLATHGWQHAPRADENGGTGYERNEIRIELTFLVEGDCGEVLIAFRDGAALWSADAFGGEVRTLRAARARVLPLGVLRAGKSVPRDDPGEAVVDRADFEALSRLPADSLG
jgi:hypothetical protein